MSTPFEAPTGPVSERQFVRFVGEMLRAANPPADAGTTTVPFGDDMAALDRDHPGLLWTTDMLMDGVDFEIARHGWYAAGRKSMLVNLSDCAAMAVRPVAALAAICAPRSAASADLIELMRGIVDAGGEYGCPVTGGDTNSWDGAAVIAVTVAGKALPNCKPARRDGAIVGDEIYISGPAGGSILGRHLTPTPRIELACRLCAAGAVHAMIDVSDGLSLDLARLLEASGCGAELTADSLEAAIHPDARQLAEKDGVSPLRHALSDGEDFELIIVAPPTARTMCSVERLIPIGRVVAASGMSIRHADGRLEPLFPAGWEHLR